MSGDDADGTAVVKDERCPQFRVGSRAANTKSAPPLPGAAGRLAIPDDVIAYPAPLIVFHIGDQTMTYELECQIEELRAELRNAVDACERRQIATELDLAQAELTLATAELDGRVDAEPPF